VNFVKWLILRKNLRFIAPDKRLLSNVFCSGVMSHVGAVSSLVEIYVISIVFRSVEHALWCFICRENVHRRREAREAGAGHLRELEGSVSLRYLQ